MLGEGRRIENYQVVLVASLLKELECIFAESLMTGVTGEVKRYIPVGEFDSLSTTIDRVHKLRPTPHSVKRESTGVTEHVQYLLASRETLQESTVLALINEKASLLSSESVDVEHQSVLYSRIIIRTAIKESVLHIVHERQRCLALVIDIFYS